MAFDASPSWSGFNYQGKVALYCALKLINTKPVGSDLSNYSLMLEDTEDFDILCDGAPISFHQVKAYNSSSYSEYSDALLGITLELYKQPGVTGKIHTWKPINSKPSFQGLIESIKNDLSNILTQYQNTDPKDGSTILEKAASTETNIKKTAAILRAAFADKTSKQLYTLIDSIFKGQNDALARLDSYQYEDGNRFCDLVEINVKIKSEIEKALNARPIPITADQLDKTFYYFLGMMDRYIIQRHKTKQQDEKIPIPFNNIIQILEADNEDIGTEYLAFKFKEKFAYLIDEYMGDPEDYTEPEEGELCNLKEARKFLLSLSPQELWVYYRDFSPQIDLQHDCNTENAFVTNLEGIRHVLIRILHTINFERVSQNVSKYNFIYRATSPPHQNYLPTTITSVARPSYIEKEIISNPNMSEVLYEVGNLIYGGTEFHVISPGSVAHTEAPRAVDEDPRSKRNEVLKKITLVPVSTAKDALT
ncbi:MAG: hypothetical protein JKY93_12875 [Gammaproteobacteria bacterium]|nr:hypothetical protein [Gammaproteobacteria bacterium]